MSKNKDSKQIVNYEHKSKYRVNNPPVGLVTTNTDKEESKKRYQFDPYFDPQLQWAGKAEHLSFEVPNVSLHVHERIDSKSIIESVKDGKRPEQLSIFDLGKKSLREAVEFYKHKENWSNRLIAGDSLLVMNSLLEKEAMGEKVQMIYFDPPYGIKYGSNFQPFTNKRDVKDGKDEDLTAEPEMIKAFRDTWELGIHSYLTYLRDRLLLAREMLHDSGSIFVQISDENVHLVRNLMDEVFGPQNYVIEITFTKTGSQNGNLLQGINDYILWYAKNKNEVKYRKLSLERTVEDFYNDGFTKYEEDGVLKKTNNFIDYKENWRKRKYFRADPLQSSNPGSRYEVILNGENFYPTKYWKTSEEGMKNLLNNNKIIKSGNNIAYKRFITDAPLKSTSNVWTDTGGASNMVYVVQTGLKPIQRCMLMTTDPGDLVFDPTCGSGTTVYIAEQYGRRWITCDTSRVATTLTKQRLLTSTFDYYKLSFPDEGVDSGFLYKTVERISLKTIASNETPVAEVLYDQPLVDRSRTRVTGPFTVEAVPAPVVKSIEELELGDSASDTSITRSGETLRQSEWKDELFKTGVRAKGGNVIEFSRVETLSGTRYLQAEAETKGDEPKKVLVSFGPEHAPLEQRQVEAAWQEARLLKPDILLFAAFQFDNEAAKDIDELTPEIAGMQLLKVQMNADLLTNDLKKKRSSNESFWLIGQPDIKLIEINKGQDKGKVQVEVLGFDYYNPKTGKIESGGKNKIAMWMLDTDYDERSLFPTQVFFPMAGAKDGWKKLAKNLRAEIDTTKIEAFYGTLSLPFDRNKQIAVKIVDDRGIESLKVVRL